MEKYTGSYGPWNWSAAKYFCERDSWTKNMSIDSPEEEDYVNENLNATTEYYSFS